jgi:ATP-binding cassette subfamily F protein 3
MEKMAKDYERQQEYIAETQDFIRRNLAGQKTKQAKSRRKMLDKLDEFERPETDETLAKFNLDGGARSGAIALTADRVTVGYGERPIVENFSIQVRRGERYAIMGPNGSGKSTLLKTFAGRLTPLAGSVSYGANIRAGYYDQTLGDLKPAGNVIDEVWDLDHSQTEEEVRSYLARFSFFGEDVYKKTRELSGGEKGRLALAKIMYVGGNVMLLDEPTNHLDVYTREALEEALENFTGALIVVSHDRYFIDRVAENVILVEDGAAEIYSGNYTDLVTRFKEGAALPKKIDVVATAAAVRRVSAEAADAAPKPVVTDRHPDRAEQKQRSKKIKKIDDEIAQLEARINSAEAERERNNLLLCSEEVFRDGERVKKIQQQNHDLKAMIELLYKKWEALASEKEAITA